jgi:hypothetical protein
MVPRGSDIIQASRLSGQSPASTATAATAATAAAIITASSDVATATAGTVATTGATSTRTVAKRESKRQVKSVHVPSNVLATTGDVKRDEATVSQRAAVLLHKVRHISSTSTYLYTVFVQFSALRCIVQLEQLRSAHFSRYTTATLCILQVDKETTATTPQAATTIDSNTIKSNTTGKVTMATVHVEDTQVQVDGVDIEAGFGGFNSMKVLCNVHYCCLQTCRCTVLAYAYRSV